MFITDEDYNSIIDSQELIVITDNSLSTRQLAESQAISKIKHLLSGKFDTDAIFDAVGDDRDITVVEYTIYYTLYILFTKIAKVKVPADRYAQYREASDFFKAVGSDLIQSNLPRKTATADNDFIDFKFGSDTPYTTTY